ncbi:hypothetical protein [Nocardiopsis sp. NPDC006938]|uniref:hypothetical protein n=1 Tax=Nocardiopsis sp. NPDC006938 TaxID=3364337 RepID=UPI003679BDC3
MLPGFSRGFSLHEELELMVRARLSPLRALQTATLEPAHGGVTSPSGVRRAFGRPGGPR